MMNHRTVAQHALVLLLTLGLSACLSESKESAEPEDTGGPDALGVSLTITSPTSTSTMDTTDPSVDLAGSAISDNGIFQVTWENSQGDQGIASGTENWQVPDLELGLGENLITITAEDIVGATTSKSISINRESGENGSVSLSWNPPTARVDGSPLTNLAGYKIYYGRMSGVYDYEVDLDNPGISSYVIEGLVSGDWFFALAAYDSDGLESDRSNEVLREIS